MALGLALILLIGTKVLLPLCVSVKTADKETAASTDQGDNSDKKTESNPLPEKEKEFANLYNNSITHLIWPTDIIHYTAYNNNYQAAHALSIHTPPPDLYLQFSA